MKKIAQCILLLTLLLSISATIVYAQEERYTISESESLSITTVVDSIGYVKASGFWDNWHIGVGFGPSILMAESDRRGPLSGRIAPAIDVSLGKWVIPSVGFRVQYSGWKARGYVNQNHMVSTAYGDELINGNWYKQKFDYHHFMGDAMFNMMNAIGEYKEDRFYTLTTYVGLGIITSKDTDATEFSGTFGLLNNFRLSPAFDLTFDIKASMMHDRFDGETESNPNIMMEGLATATIGISYKFKPRGWRSAKINILNVDHDEIINYQNRLAQAQKEKQDIINQLKECQDAQPIVIKEIEYTVVTAPVFFDKNKSVISNRERVKLSYIAEFINNSPEDKTFKVVGCADKQTGNSRINERLGKERSKAVYQTLVNDFGVDESKLVMENRGGVDYMFFNDNELSRVVVLEY